MPDPDIAYLTVENRELISLLHERDRRYVLEPERWLPILRPCRVKVLLVADGGLDFSLNDFGLRTFVLTLQSIPTFYVRFDITVAHISNVSDDSVMVGHPGIARSIKQFKFDDPGHFAPAMYDQVWLFGIQTSYAGRGTSPGGQPYPTGRLGDAELRALSEFMDGGGGLFATGDHGALGVCLSGAVPRARSMRLWGDTSGNNNTNEVSMSGPRRNDTNRLGHDAGSQFNDQSDDVPQPINPKMFHRRWGIWRFSYPHPLLCGPKGVIRVMPDHPHEGECVEPGVTNRTDTFAGYTITEYPASPGPFSRPLPDVISTATVLSGTVSGVKQPTQSQTFGGICAYDGHLAGVGRVVTDATWHHFVNVNLVGDSSAPAPDPKRMGFLATVVGQAHLEQVKAYYRNIAIWLSRPASLTCMRRRICWGLVWHHRVMEAVLTRTDVGLRRVDLPTIFEIGRHARDVLGLYAGQCQSRRIALDLIVPVLRPEILWWLDPWIPPPKKGPIPEPDPVPWFDPDPLLDAALGGALVAIRDKYDVPDLGARERDSEEDLDRVIATGVKTAMDLASRSLRTSGQQFVSAFSTVGKDVGTPRTKASEPSGKGRKRKK